MNLMLLMLYIYTGPRGFSVRAKSVERDAEAAEIDTCIRTKGSLTLSLRYDYLTGRVDDCKCRQPALKPKGSL